MKDQTQREPNEETIEIIEYAKKNFDEYGIVLDNNDMDELNVGLYQEVVFDAEEKQLDLERLSLDAGLKYEIARMITDMYEDTGAFKL